MSQNNCDCACPRPSITLPITGLGLSVDPTGLDCGGIDPGPDGTHLVTRNGKLVWEAIGSGASVVEGNVDLYVSPDGDDTNDGRTQATAMATVHRAAEYLSGILYIGQATVHIADGTYAGDLLRMWALPGRVAFVGESREGTVLAFNFSFDQTTASIQNLTMTNSEAYHVWATHRATVVLSNVTLQGSNSSANVVGASVGGLMILLADCMLSGTVRSFLRTYDGGTLSTYGTVTCNGTCAAATVNPSQGGIMRLVGPITGTVTGKKYDVRSNAVLSLAGATLPGSAAGVTSTGGQVVA